MISRFKNFLLLAAVGLACRPTVAPPPVPPPPPPNSPPVARPGGPYNSTNGTVVFDGRASSDPDGDPITYRWTFGDGSTSEAAQPTHEYSADGSFSVSLIVTDDKGAASTPAGTTAIVTRPEPGAVLVGAGNVASSGNNDEATARLIDAMPGAHVFTAGDNAFPDGSDNNYTTYYEPTWGRFRDRTRPALGNHDYQTSDAEGAFNYFGDRLGPTRGLGYYSYNINAWHIIVLNDKGATGIDDTQIQWLIQDLSANSDKRCTIAIWHSPLWTSSNTPGYTSNPNQRRIWDALFARGVDITINGHPHFYERFTPMTPTGTVDQAAGIRQFNVGTGGGDGVSPPTEFHPNSEVQSATFGVLKLTLRANDYDWQFVAVPGASFTDSGTGTCH